MAPGSRVRLDKYAVGENGISFMCGAPEDKSKTSVKNLQVESGRLFTGTLYPGAGPYTITGPAAKGVYKVDVVCKAK